MAPYRPGKRPLAVAILTACFGACPAHAQVANSFNFSGVALPPSAFTQAAPGPLLPEPGGAFTAQTNTMPVPPLARTTIPSAGSPGADATGAPQPPGQEDGPSHAALDDRVLDGVR